VLDSVPRTGPQLCTYTDVPEAHRALLSLVVSTP